MERRQIESDLACLRLEAGSPNLPSSAQKNAQPTAPVLTPTLTPGELADSQVADRQLADRLAQYKTDRLARIDKFLVFLQQKNDAFIEKLLEIKGQSKG